MTRKLRRNSLLRLVVLSSTILIVVMALLAAAQVTLFRRPLRTLQSASATRDTRTPTHLENHLPADAGNAAHVAMAGSQQHPPSAGLTGPGPLIFLPAVFYPSGGKSDSVAVADFNRDGIPDVVVANYDDSVGVLLGTGDGSFQPVVNYASGGYSPVSVAVGDFNGDGIPDLVVANKYAFDYTSPVAILLGNGDGTFQPAALVPFCCGSPASVTVADVNGDGKADLIVAFSDHRWVLVELGNGDGTFNPSLTDSGGLQPSSVAVADVNGDGKLDVLVANMCSDTSCAGHGSVGVLLGNGDGTFQAAVTYDSGGSYTSSVAVGDLNGDGIPDLLVANRGSGFVGVLRGNGDGTFQPAITYDSGGTPYSVAIADVNGDGKPDSVVANDSGVGVLLGNGDGTFQAAMIYSPGGTAMAVADLNGDKKPDLLTVNGWYAVCVLINNSGSPTTATSLLSNVNPADIKAVVTYTATVASESGGTLNGTVTFKDGNTPIATVTLANNQAAYSASYTAKQIGVHPITATYSGVLHVAEGSQSAALAEYVRNALTQTVVTTSGSPSLFGQPVTFTAIVRSNHGPIPDGELVTFHERTTTLASVPLAGGVASYTTSSLAARTHYIKATYAGDTTFEPSTGWVKQVVNKYPTTTVLSSSPNPSAFEQVVTFTATVTPAGPYPPTGKVWFKDAGTGIGYIPMNGGVATLTKRLLAVGTHAITAEYMGDGANARSTSSVLNQVVQ